MKYARIIILLLALSSCKKQSQCPSYVCEEKCRIEYQSMNGTWIQYMPGNYDHNIVVEECIKPEFGKWIQIQYTLTPYQNGKIMTLITRKY
mgnify:CR=1 FL=1